MVDYTSTLPRRPSHDTVRFPVHACFSVFCAYLFARYRSCIRVAFGAWRDDFLLIQRADTPPNSPYTPTDSSTTVNTHLLEKVDYGLLGGFLILN